MICSGAIVFLDSCSQISFASDEIKCINSSGNRSGKGIHEENMHASPTQHSMMRSLVSLAQTMSFGSSSGDVRVRIDKRQRRRRMRPAIIFETVAFGRERSSSPGGPVWPSRSDIVAERRGG